MPAAIIRKIQIDTSAGKCGGKRFAAKTETPSQSGKSQMRVCHAAVKAS